MFSKLIEIIKKAPELFEYLLLVILISCFIILTLSLFSPAKTTAKVVHFNLNNNLELLYKKIPSDLVSVQAWIKAGTYYETATDNGLAHFLEHMLFKNKELVNQIEEKGGYFNAATSYDFTYYHITLPKEHLDFAVQALGQIVFANQFNASDFQTEKSVILEEIARSKDNPRQQIYDFIFQKVYSGHPYAQKVLGTSSAIKNYSLEKLHKFYQKYYLPDNATFVIAGDISLSQIKTIIKQLEKYPSRQLTKPLIRANFQQPNLTYFQKRIKNLSNTTLYYVYSVPGVSSKDSYTLDVLTELLANRTNSLLNKTLKDQHGLTYKITAHYQTRKKRSLFIIKIPLKKNLSLKKIQSLYQEIIEKPLINSEDLDLIKLNIKKDHLKQNENVDDSAFTVGYFHLIDDYSYAEKYLENINNVQAKDIQAVLDKYFGHPYKFLFIPRGY